MIARRAAKWTAMLMMFGLAAAVGASQPAAAGKSDGAAREVASRPAVPPTPDFASAVPMLVVEVLDGRSLVLQGAQGQEIVSLLGVEPLGAGGEGSAGRGAKEALRDLVLGEQVHALDHEKGARADASGRRACYVYRAPEGTFVNLELIRQGYAGTTADFAYQHLEVFKAWGKAAKAAGRGVYTTPAGGTAAPSAPSAPGTDGSNGTGAGTGSAPTGAGEVKPANIAPSGTTLVYVTRSGTKYHTQACRFAKSGSPMCLADAKAKKLEPCSQCSPPK